MPLRLAWLVPALLSSAMAADQTPAAPKPDDSTTAAKPVKESKWGIHLGGVMVGAGYSRGWGGYFPGYWGPYSYYDPFLWTPFYAPGYFTGFAYGPRMGDVKIQNLEKSSTVFLDGALAGRLDRLKDMWLDPGTYQLEVRDGKRRYTQKIYVLSGKTLKVTGDMMNQETLP